MICIIRLFGFTGVLEGAALFTTLELEIVDALEIAASSRLPSSRL
jgi:hypothetical protein